MADEQDRAEARDESELGDEYPPEHPLGVDTYGTTPAEERIDEPIHERIRREVPESTGSHAGRDPRVGDLTAEPDADGREVAAQVDIPEADPERAADDLEGSGMRSAEQDAVHVRRNRPS